jgi:hypothetical protein
VTKDAGDGMTKADFDRQRKAAGRTAWIIGAGALLIYIVTYLLRA